MVVARRHGHGPRQHARGRRPAGRRPPRAPASRSMPVEQTTTSGRSSAVDPGGRRGDGLAQVTPSARAGAPGPDGRRRPGRDGPTTTARSHRSVASVLARWGCGAADAQLAARSRRPGRGASSRDRSGNSRRWARRSWRPTPTSSRRRPSSTTTRATSRPSTSPVSTPYSTTGSAPWARSTSANAAAPAAGQGAGRTERRARPGADRGRSTCHTVHRHGERGRPPGHGAAVSRSPHRRAGAARLRPGAAPRPGPGRGRASTARRPAPTPSGRSAPVLQPHRNWRRPGTAASSERQPQREQQPHPSGSLARSASSTGNTATGAAGSARPATGRGSGAELDLEQGVALPPERLTRPEGLLARRP